MRRVFSIVLLTSLCLFAYSRDMVITKLNQSPIMIGNRSLKVGDTFSDAEVISWSSKKQDMKAKPKSGGLPRHYSAAAFKSKSQHNISIQQYLKYLNKTNKPSTQDIGDLYLQKSEKRDKYPERRIALVIGNSIYGLLGRDLDCPISDAEDVTSTLNELGFDTYTLYDATNVDFHSALMKFSNVASAEGYDVALFYYCGHGSQNDGKNYLLPCDAKNDSPEDLSTWISFDAVFESLSETGCKTKLAFLDACRNAPRWQSQDKASRLDQYDTMGSLVVYSTANNMEALGEQEEESRNTPFGAAFLESALKPSENISLTIKSISESVRERTEYYTKYGESPRQVYTFGVGDVDFSFVPENNFESECNKARRYIAEDNPEMAIVFLNQLKEHYSFLDSIQQSEYKSIVNNVHDKLLCSNAYLVSIEDSGSIKKDNKFDHLKGKNNKFIRIPYDINDQIFYLPDETDSIEAFVRSRGDTIYFSDFVVNQLGSHISFYDDKNTMALIDLNKGHCFSLFNDNDYPYYAIPLALNNKADKLVYFGGDDYHRSEKMFDCKTNSRNDLDLPADYYDDGYGVYGRDIVSFSPNDSLFFFTNGTKVLVYKSSTLDLIHTFNYNECDTVFWDENNYLSISSCGVIYRWSIKESSFIQTINTSINFVDLAISDNLQKVAAISLKGEVSFFDLFSGNVVSTRISIDTPDYILFSPDNQSLWITSRYYKTICIDVSNLQAQILNEELESFIGPDFSCSFMYMTPDNKYCITYLQEIASVYGTEIDFDKFRIYDVKTKAELDFDKDLLNHYFYKISDDNLSYADICDMFDRIIVSFDYLNQGPQLSIKKYSRDESTIVEGYTDGTIKLISANAPNEFLELMKPIEGV